jgi:hypothetical protein
MAGWEQPQSQGQPVVVDGNPPPLQANVPPPHPNTAADPPADPKKKGIFGKIRDIFHKPE